jgi:hypothetical protein
MKNDLISQHVERGIILKNYTTPDNFMVLTNQKTRRQEATVPTLDLIAGSVPGKHGKPYVINVCFDKAATSCTFLF